MNLSDIPEGPTNVRVLRDGREIPVETVYVGRDEKGVEVFEAAIVAFLPTDKLLMDKLPGNTAIRISSPRRDPS